MPRKRSEQDDARSEAITKGEFKRDRHTKPKVDASIPTPLRPDMVPLTTQQAKPVELDLDCIHPNPANSNVMDNLTFDALVKSIREVGFVEPVIVAPLMDTDPRIPEGDKRTHYELVGGEHRWEAARVLAPEMKWKTIWAVVHVGLKDQDSRDLNLVRLNVIKGDIDPAKFTAQWNRLMEKYGSETTMELMGFVDESVLKDYILDAEESLPTPEAKREFQKQKKKIKTMEDLSRIINNIFAKYGSTVELSFMSFEYGGHTHCVVWMDRATLNIVEEITTTCAEHQIDINKVMQVVLTRGWDKTVPELLQGEEVGTKDEVFDEDEDDEEDDGRMDPSDPVLDPEGFGDDNPDDEVRRVQAEIAAEKQSKPNKKRRK